MVTICEATQKILPRGELPVSYRKQNIVDTLIVYITHHLVRTQLTTVLVRAAPGSPL